jgi:hypothetical protein
MRRILTLDSRARAPRLSPLSADSSPLPDMRKGDPEAAPVAGRVTREAGKNKSATRTGLSAAADEELLANFETLPQNL